MLTGITSSHGFDDGYYFDPAAHSPLENLVDIAQQELTEEETLFGLYEDSHHNNTDGSIGTAAGSIGSSCSAFDFYYDGCELNNRAPFKRSNNVVNNLNNNNNNTISKHMDSHLSMGDFFMEDELNLSDPTKSSWRHDIVPIPGNGGGPVLGHIRSGPYLDMTYNHGTPKHSRSKAVPICTAFSVPESPRHLDHRFSSITDSPHHLDQYSTSKLAKQK
jgi:hypothetical protein